MQWLKRLFGWHAELPVAVPAVEPDQRETLFAGGVYQVNKSAASVRPRTAQFRREGIVAIFEAWNQAFQKERLRDGYAPPLSDLNDPEYGQRCAQVFLDLAAQLWPADEAITVLKDSVSTVPDVWRVEDGTNVQKLVRRLPR